MARLTHDELIILLMSISIMLILSRIVAELGKKIKMPLVMGEIMVGIILGPTIFGIMYPDMSNILFPQIGSKAIGAAIALDGIVNLSVIMLLFVVGLEVQLPLVLKQGRLVIYTSISSMIIPFFTGFATAWYFPQLFGVSNSETKPLFALFFGTALSISALPVIARILMDMNLFKTNIGMLIIASATFVDLIGWLIFSFILSLTGNDNGVSIGYSITYIIGFGLFMLTIGKKIIDKSLPWMQKNYHGREEFFPYLLASVYFVPPSQPASRFILHLVHS